MGPFKPYAENITSQFGEDGILREIFARLGIVDDWCVELGAWDGRHLSNTWHLWHDLGWSAVLIEAHPERFQELYSSTSGRDTVTALQALAQPSGPFTLDNLLGTTSIPHEFGLLSIDVDGDDYHIWAGLRSYTPQVVVIEYNPSFPVNVRYIQESGEHLGSSALSLLDLGQQLGYRLVEMTETNMMFVRSAAAMKLGVDSEPLSALFEPRHVPLVVSDYNGLHFMLKPGPWGYSGIRLTYEGAPSRARRLKLLLRRFARRILDFRD